MATIVKIGPADHGRPITEEQLRTGEFKEGYKYEVIDGRLYVSYEPDAPQGLTEWWLFMKLNAYSIKHSEIINYVWVKSRVFVHSRPDLTVPEPDLAAYHDFPFHLPRKKLQWENVSPILVAEVLSPDDPDKDLVRNVELYLLVPSIKEYWIVDGLEDPDRPSMLVYRRHGTKWRKIDVAPGETYTTRLLPGFKLLLDPRR